MDSLPTEILHAIFFLVDQKSQKHLRLANRRFSKLGQGILFQTVSVSPTEESYNRIEEILQRPYLASHVTKIYLNTFDPKKVCAFLSQTKLTSQVPQCQYGEGEDTGECLFGYLKDIPRLQSVVLRFHPECAEGQWEYALQGQDFRSAVLKQAYSTLSGMPQIEELAMRDLQNFNETDQESASNLSRVLSNLRSLRLNIANVNRGMDGSSDYHRENPQRFFPELPSTWLSPCLSTLQHFTLYSNHYCGFYPKLDLRGIHFPHLQSLALGNHAFVNDSQLNWILSHSTLTELYLDDCAILYEVAISTGAVQKAYLPAKPFKQHPDLHPWYVYSSYSTRWADYFRAFNDNLPRLRHFRYGHSPNWWVDDSTPFECEGAIEVGFHAESYLVFRDGLLPSEYMEQMDWVTRDVEGGFDHVTGKGLQPSKEDKAALEELCKKMV